MKTNPSISPALSPHQSFRRCLWRVSAALLLVFGAVGCAHHRSSPDGKTCGVGGGPRTTSFGGSFIAAPYNPCPADVNITKPTTLPMNPTKSISLTVAWTTTGNYGMRDGVVTVYLIEKLTGIERYCCKKALNAQTAPGLNLQPLTIKVPLGTFPSTGTHKVRRYITGYLTDGTAMKPYTEPDFPNGSTCSHWDPPQP